MPSIRAKIHNKRAIIDVGIQPSTVLLSGVTPVQTSAQFNIIPRRGLIDTGATITCVTRRAAHDAGLKPRGKRLVGNVHDVEVHTAYSFVLGVWYTDGDGDGLNETKGWYGFDPVLGADVKDSDDFDVLIGMDLILQGDLRIGRNGYFEWVLP